MGTSSPITIKNPNTSRRHQIIILTRMGANVFNIANDWKSIISQSNQELQLTLNNDYSLKISGLEYYQMCLAFIVN